MPVITSAEFSRLFTEYKDRLVVLANSYVHDTHAAEDIVADAFTKFWDRREAAAQQGSPAMYLYVMVRNRCLNYLRDKAARQKINDARLKADISVLESGEPERMMGGDLERVLSRYLESIPADRREIFCASRFEGLSHTEIVVKYGYSPRKVRREIGRVLADLRELLISSGLR